MIQQRRQEKDANPAPAQEQQPEHYRSGNPHRYP
jgi:hypothetical protein